ncbi:hypothetical protein HMPREF1977_1503 [Capnocytophaga ochracea F0287]|uniref:Uncharacterized protein n=1 Tax=Capnocytophaga ochracea F0287 TaxID=873517 RepID=E4MSZ3_CAPOC|nr:hypothetical protein HMPREF1977_1503 [Capnocytophaga ochracea F0287]
MPIMPEISIIPPRGMDGADFSDGSDRLEERLKNSEGNGRNHKKTGRSFDEKRV